MKKIKLIPMFHLLLLLLLNGCAGLGLNKKATLIPDEIKMEIDMNPQDDWRSREVTGGAVWKFK